MFPSCWFSWGLSFSSMKSCTHFWCCMVFTIVLECSINIRLQFRCQMFFCFVLFWGGLCLRAAAGWLVFHPSSQQVPVTSVWGMCGTITGSSLEGLELLFFSHQRVNICNIPNGEKVVQSLPSAAAWWTWLMYSKTRLPQPLRCVLGACWVIHPGFFCLSSPFTVSPHPPLLPNSGMFFLFLFLRR